MIQPYLEPLLGFTRERVHTKVYIDLFTTFGMRMAHRTDNTVVDAIKLILLNYSNFNIAKIVVKEIEMVKLTQSRLPTNTKLIFNKLVLIKSIQNS